MRSLTPTTVQVARVGGDGYVATQVAVDPENGTVYTALERVNEDGVAIDIVRQAHLDEGCAFPESIASFSSPVLAAFPVKAQTLNLHYFSDDRTLIVLLAGGDIAVLQLENPNEGIVPIEVVGSIDSGIKAAAWSPDDEQLVLIDGQDQLLCMTRTFDTIFEGPLRVDDFGEDKFINVGWGSEGTQFHGSLGKKALLAAQEKKAGPSSLSHETDDGLPRISFKGDAAYFAVSSLDPYPLGGARRQVRVYSRDASAGFAPTLSSTSELLPGLEPSIAWRPIGNVIASLVRYGYEGGGEGRKGRWDVAMLERNGLRHGGFELREGEATWESGYVHHMAWNSESDVLAIWIRRAEEDVVQLWTMKNYHYYLKQEIRPLQNGSRRFNSLKWHPEQPMSLYLVSDDNVQLRSFTWDIYASRLPMPNDTAAVAVVDGDRLLVTPFRTQNTPPPMSSFQLALPSQPTHVSMSPTEDAVAVLYASGLVQIWDLGIRLPEAGASRLRAGGKVAEPKLRWERTLTPEGEFIAKQVRLSAAGEVGALFWSDGNSGTVLLTADKTDVRSESGVLPCAEYLLWDAKAGWLVADHDGMLESAGALDTLVSLCPKPQKVEISSDAGIVFALSDTGKLFAANLQSRESVELATNVNSFTLSPDTVMYTTTAQSSHYASLASVAQVLDGELLSTAQQVWESRRVERGAIAVVSCPSSMSLVLQMPRGNLETIYPRPLVLAVVRRDIIAGDYRAAFLACRKHRLDLNILHDLAPEQFMSSLEEFVKQVPEVDYLNLFITSLNSSDSSLVLYPDLKNDATRPPIPETKINNICDAMCKLVIGKDLTQYVETVLTTHVCKQPPDYEAGLDVLLKLQDDHPEIVEEAVKYMIFLSNVNQLYDVALGMYNFRLVLMVAQYSQKDPKEYLPFLRELRELEQHEQRFRIDDHLGRREKALGNLHAAGPLRFDDAASYLSRYELYDEAFKLYKDDAEHLPVVYDLYGDYLYDRRDFHEAAISYSLGGKPERALKAYEKAHAWRELFTLASQLDQPKEAVTGWVDKVTDYLGSRGRHSEAAQIFIDYGNDVDGAVEVLCRGAEFAEANRLASRHSRGDLVGDVIHPALDEAHEVLTETLEEMDGQLAKEVTRLAELHVIRVQDPDNFYLVDDEPELENVDVATNATTVATAFTRYTVAPTTVFSQSTHMTGQTNKSKHKPSRKRQAGRKGTVDEYDYLVASVGRLVKRVDDKSAEANTLLRDLVLASPEHRELASTLQAAVLDLRAKLANALDAVWADRETILADAHASGGMGLGGDVAAARALERPQVSPWKGLSLLV